MKYIVFDFDGTIADVLPILDIISQKAVRKYHLPEVTPEKIAQARNMTVSEILQTFHIPFILVPILGAYVKNEQRKMIHDVKPVEGITNLIYSLHQKGYTLGIVTSNNEETVRTFLSLHSMDVFSFVHSESNIFGKHRALKKMLSVHNIQSDDILYIGDEVRDIDACKKVGIPIISVPWGLNGKKILTAYRPEYVVDTPQDILKIIEGHTSS